MKVGGEISFKCPPTSTTTLPPQQRAWQYFACTDLIDLEHSCYEIKSEVCDLGMLVLEDSQKEK